MPGNVRNSEMFNQVQMELLEQINDMTHAIEAIGITDMRGRAIVALLKELSSDLCSSFYVKEKVDILFGR